jgi:hypothetical protein
MIYPSLLVAAFLWSVFIAVIGGHWKLLGLFVDFPSLVCVLSVTAGYIAVCGYKKFFTGLQAILHRPQQHQTDVADYFRNLARFTLTLGIVLPAIFLVITLCNLDPDRLGIWLSVAIFTCFYSIGLALFFYMPISYRFSGGDSNFKFHILTVSALLRIILLFAIFAVVAFAIGISVPEIFSGFIGSWNWNFLDIPSLLLIVTMLGTCRLGMGKIVHCRDWMPICILIGVMGSLCGTVVVLSNFDPESFVPGITVSVLPAIYGCVFACVAAFNNQRVFWIFTMVSAVLVLAMYMVFVILLMLLAFW